MQRVFPLPEATLSEVFKRQDEKVQTLIPCVNHVPRGVEPKLPEVTASMARHRKDICEDEAAVSWRDVCSLCKKTDS